MNRALRFLESGLGENMNQQLLIIDDSPQIHPLIRTILAEEPVDIQSATDPNYGLTLAASMHPDLILLDVEMPGMTGFEACRKLKENPETADVPVIFLTSVSEVKKKVEGFSVGAVDYVTKPFNPTELKARVNASLRTENHIRSLEEKALIDPLTGLGNRAMFMHRFEAEVASRIRFNNDLSVILMDIDHFKDINDTYGHLIGDRVLQRVGKIIADLCRTEDVACRFGGEEFVIIAPHTTAEDAEILAERIREIIANTRFTPEGFKSSPMLEECIRLSASFGVAEAGDLYDRSMLKRADEAMYRSKQEGRNRVTIAGPWVQDQEAAA